MSSGPRECKDPGHAHVLMCPVQASQVAAAVVMAGMARREDGIGLIWWDFGLKELRFADAEAAVRGLVSGGIGDRSWITARDVIRAARAIRRARHDKAPPPVPPAGLTFPQEQKFIRWYWTAVGNGEQAATALELAAGGVGHDRYLEPAAPDTGEPVEAGSIESVRAALEEAKRKENGRG